MIFRRQAGFGIALLLYWVGLPGLIVTIYGMVLSRLARQHKELEP